jgi:inhibitor of cysteine peptidase
MGISKGFSAWIDRLRFWKSRIAGRDGRNRSTGLARQRFQPGVEILEDRCLPSAGLINAAVTPPQADGDNRPTQFGSADALKQYLIDQAVQQYSYLLGQPYQWYYFDALFPIVFASAAESAASAFSTGGSPTYSTTNTQVAGVDEGDTVKTDGKYLYLLSNGTLDILNAWPATSLQSLSVTALPGNPLAEYLDGDRLTVIIQEYPYAEYPYAEYPYAEYPYAEYPYAEYPYAEYPYAEYPYALYTLAEPGGFFPPNFLGGNTDVKVIVYDVSNRAAPTIVQETTLDGSYNSSRAIGNTVYVALNDTLPSLPAPQYTFVGNSIDSVGVYQTEAEYRAMLEAIPLDSVLPHYTTDYANAMGKHEFTGLLTAPADIYQAGVAGDNNLVSLVSFDVAGDSAAAGPKHSVSLLTSYSATLYAAPDNFYLVTNRWSDDSNWTFIDKLSLGRGDIALTATGRVPGTILNQFSIGENGAYLDIATTSGGEEIKTDSGWTWNTGNNLYVLAENGNALDVVGKLENLAHGESIFAVRFLGDRAFISTFERRDPLFAIDLSDPTDPVVAGKLEVSGYTAYLQAIDATHLLGIGANVDATTGNVLGVEISLFDVTDLNNPTLISRYDVSPNGWSWSNAAYDYHAIAYYPEFQALALPVSGQTEVTAPDGSIQWIYQTGLLVLRVDPAGTLSLQGEVSDASAIQRGVFIGNMLYAASSTSVQAFSLADLNTQVAQVQLPAPVYVNWEWWGPILSLPIVVAPVYLSGKSDGGTVDVFSPVPPADSTSPSGPSPVLMPTNTEGKTPGAGNVPAAMSAPGNLAEAVVGLASLTPTYPPANLPNFTSVGVTSPSPMATSQTISPSLFSLGAGQDTKLTLPLDAENSDIETQQAPTTLLEPFDDAGSLLGQDGRDFWQPSVLCAAFSAAEKSDFPVGIDFPFLVFDPPAASTKRQ